MQREKEEVRRLRLQQFKDILREKTQTKAEFKAKHDIDFDILLDPEHAQFSELYTFEDAASENLVMAAKLKMVSNNWRMMQAFTVYHVAKFFLWRKGYAATFFYRTRFLSPVILTFSIWINMFRCYPSNLQKAGVIDYNRKRVRFEKDIATLQSLLHNRMSYLKEVGKEQESTTNIQTLVNQK